MLFHAYSTCTYTDGVNCLSRIFDNESRKIRGQNDVKYATLKRKAKNLFCLSATTLVVRDGFTLCGNVAFLRISRRASPNIEYSNFVDFDTDSDLLGVIHLASLSKQRISTQNFFTRCGAIFAVIVCVTAIKIKVNSYHDGNSHARREQIIQSDSAKLAPPIERPFTPGGTFAIMASFAFGSTTTNTLSVTYDSIM